MALTKPRRLLPFRIPFFRIFYSGTYTTLYIILLCLLAITPASMIWQSVDNKAYQYTIIIGGVYLLTALVAIFVYASRLYSNRTALADVGKAYIPIEPGEVGKKVRKMIVKHFERSAMIAWESRPRDLLGEIVQAEKEGVLPPETASVGRDDYTVGQEIPVDPAFPPWGDVQHPGWSSPARSNESAMPDVQFTTIIAELPHLIEARAVSLAPVDPAADDADDASSADPIVVDVLRRPNTAGMRDYLTQLSYLGLVNPISAGQHFLRHYEHARFCDKPLTGAEFRELMSAFATLLAGMNELDAAVLDEIYAQAGAQTSLSDDEDTRPPQRTSENLQKSSSPPRSSDSSATGSFTARTAPSQNRTPYMHSEDPSFQSLSSVLHHPPESNESGVQGRHSTSSSSSLAPSTSETGSIVHHSHGNDHG